MRKFKKLMVPVFTFSILFSFPGCLHNARQNSMPARTKQSTGNIYLHGEQHAVEKILNKEIEIWGDYYTNQGLRHLFLETPYYTAEFLNIWMNSEGDEMLDSSMIPIRTQGP